VSTVYKALTELVQKGLLVRRKRHETFIRERAAARSLKAEKAKIDLREVFAAESGNNGELPTMGRLALSHATARVFDWRKCSARLTS
jgi:DNA-binding FadR family transcriptional regulator